VSRGLPVELHFGLPLAGRLGGHSRCRIPVRSSTPVGKIGLVPPNDRQNSTIFIVAVRRCLVCDFVEETREAETEDLIGPPCTRCKAPTERVQVLNRRSVPQEPNPHAAALGRLGGLKGGPARARALSAKRRREIAKAAARVRWGRSR
jgi:hypothetical protein